MLQPRILLWPRRLPPRLCYLFFALATRSLTTSAQSPSPSHSPSSTPSPAAAHASTPPLPAAQSAAAAAAASASASFPSNGPPPPNDGNGDGDNGHNDGILNFYFLILIGVALAGFTVYWTVVRRRRQNLAKSRLTQHDALAQDVRSWSTSGATPSGRSGGGWLGWTSFSSSASTAFRRPTADSAAPGIYYDGQAHEAGGLRYGFFNWRSRAGSLGVRPWDAGNEEHSTAALPPPPYVKEPENVHLTVLTSSTVSLDRACHDCEANPTATGTESRHRRHSVRGSGGSSGRESGSASGTDAVITAVSAADTGAHTDPALAAAPASTSVDPRQATEPGAHLERGARRRSSVASRSSLAAAVDAAGSTTDAFTAHVAAGLPGTQDASDGARASGEPPEYTPRRS